MIAIDTNVVVRVFVDDLNTAQVTAARNLVKKAKTIYLTQIVLVEMVWVLLRAYGLNKSQILAILDEIQHNAAFSVENEKQFHDAIGLFKEFNTDFSDCMILAQIKEVGIKQIYSFDKKFQKIKDVINPAIMFR